MTEEKSPWVGDQVYDADAGREGVISDVKNGTYVLREVDSWARTWTAPSAEKLTVTVPRTERIKRERET
ncbi:hypothetical protein OH738_10885 [Streptomyces hirsutus]|uniref:hypothetical protein n=1 Tax=Streptomyces hirsutus TaxID=35620 RepID=UPI003869443D|nr:hypothetical protein OH738_10885 [Streptomyces hirsutus]